MFTKNSNFDMKKYTNFGNSQYNIPESFRDDETLKSHLISILKNFDKISYGLFISKGYDVVNQKEYDPFITDLMRHVASFYVKFIRGKFDDTKKKDKYIPAMLNNNLGFQYIEEAERVKGAIIS